jgi:hypothetical protein
MCGQIERRFEKEKCKPFSHKKRGAKAELKGKEELEILTPVHASFVDAAVISPLYFRVPERVHVVMARNISFAGKHNGLSRRWRSN